MPIDKEPIDLLQLLTTLVREREQAIVGAGLGLDLKGKRGTLVHADPRQLGRALGNLLDNAINGTPEGGHILIELPRPDASSPWSAVVVVTDDGQGMSDADLARALGEAGTGEDGALEKRSGLGIPLARQLIEAHEGVLEITSQEGVGTTAIIRLP
jgi:signal transduction histidine kinase